MNIKDCEAGMKVERFFDSCANVKKGSVYTVAGVNIKGESVRLKETNDNYWYDLNMFRLAEPVNQFEVGDEVLYKAENGINYECTIFGIAKQKDKFDGKYAISFVKGSGKVVNKIVKECKLSQLKKKDELQVGDKFKDYSGNTVKVLARENNPVNTTYYFCRTNSENIDVWTHHDVREIIYD